MTTIQTKVCKHCGVTFQTKPINNGNRQRFCNPKCTRAAYAPTRAIYYQNKHKGKRSPKSDLKTNLKLKGLTIEDYEIALQNQNYCCAICRQPETAQRQNATANEIRRLAVDHSHKYGTYRGLLCMRCNTALGKFNDDIAILQKAIQYLEKHNLAKYMGTQ